MKVDGRSPRASGSTKLPNGMAPPTRISVHSRIKWIVFLASIVFLVVQTNLMWTVVRNFDLSFAAKDEWNATGWTPDTEKQTSQKQELAWIPPPRFKLLPKKRKDILHGRPVLRMCKDCQTAKIHPKLSCRRRMEPWLMNNLTWEQLRVAQEVVWGEKPKECGSCNPRFCDGSVDVETGFDFAAPKTLWGKTHTIQSLPASYRIPADVIAQNKTEAHFANWKDGDFILYTYNPSLVPVPDAIKKDYPKAAYLASFRLSPLHTCAPTTYNFFEHRHLSLLGLAVLDKELNSLVDGVIDVNTALGDRHFVDYRFFVLEGILYLSEGRRLLAVEVSTQPTEDAMPNEFGNGLFMKNVTPVVRITNVAPIKNNQFFTGQNGKLYMEVWPIGPREVKSISIENDGNNVSASVNSYETKQLPQASFVSNEHLMGQQPYVFSRGRGSACCTQISKDLYRTMVGSKHKAMQYDYVLAGIDHVKSVQIRGKFYIYLSRLYAFAPVEPFAVVARSGFFCFSSVKEPSQDPHVLLLPNNYDGINNQLNIRKNPYDCPRVHFVSGMADSVTNSSQVIVSYGINDCVPRMVVVEKQELAEKLFLPMAGRRAIHSD